MDWRMQDTMGLPVAGVEYSIPFYHLYLMGFALPGRGAMVTDLPSWITGQAAGRMYRVERLIRIAVESGA